MESCINLGSRHHHTPSMRVSDTLHAEGMARKTACVTLVLRGVGGKKPSESLNHKPSCGSAVQIYVVSPKNPQWRILFKNGPSRQCLLVTDRSTKRTK